MLGFTPKESKFIIFLLLTFLIGLGIRIFQFEWASLPETPSLTLKNHDKSQENIKKVQTLNNKNDNKINYNNNKYVLLNQATLDDFKKLPGIGPVKAERILQYRESKGFFSSIDELKNVKGIGEKTIEKLRPFLKINLKNQSINMEENR